jgi:HSP20 family molecular chaperone IbpA
MNEKFLNTSAVAKILGVGTDRVAKYVRDGKLTPATRTMGTYRNGMGFHPEDIERFRQERAEVERGHVTPLRATKSEKQEAYEAGLSKGLDEGGAETFLISIAVAGFARNELEVIAEDNQIIVRGRQTEDGARQYLHRGIAARQFQRTFLLADGMRVEGAELANGLLVITVYRPVTKPVSRRIDIRSVE